MLFVGTSIIHPSTEGVFLLCNILDLLIYSKYNENVSRTIMDNCGNLIYLHTREISFLEYISKLAGQNEFDRPLLSVSRLQHLKKNETVIFHDRCYPVVVRDLPLIFEYPMKASA